MRTALTRSMKLTTTAIGGCGLFFIGSLACMTSCSDPTGLNTQKQSAISTGDGGAPVTTSLQQTFNENCPAGDDWIPGDGGPPPPVRMFDPAPHPDTECPFYRGVYQNFMIVATPDANGEPAFLRYPTIFDAFTFNPPLGFVRNTGPSDPNLSPSPFENPGGAAAAAKVLAGPPTGLSMFGIVHQAGRRNILVDRDHHTLYYTVEMNQIMANFIRDNHLDTPAGINAVDPNLELPAGVVLLKSAWKDIDPRDFPDKTGKLGTMNGVVPPSTDLPGDPGDFSNYITANVWLPWLTQNSDGTIAEDPDHPVLRKVALVAIHVVYSLPGHPELIWGSIQHVNPMLSDPAVEAETGQPQPGMPDTQPDPYSSDGGFPLLPPTDQAGIAALAAPLSMNNYLMYTAGTPGNMANSPANSDMDLQFDGGAQTFGMTHNVYRMFPGSKSTTPNPDTAVLSLNHNVTAMFSQAIASNAISQNIDKRQYYRLLSAVWMDKPALFSLGTKDPQTGLYPGVSLQNDDGTNILANDAMLNPPNVHPEVSQGVTCGTPTGTDGQPPLSGDAPGATGFNNTVPGCDTRYDDLLLPDAGNPTPDPNSPDGGPPQPVNPNNDFGNHTIGTDSAFSILGGEDRMSSTVMESFTQTGTFKDCFACHNTQPINDQGVAPTPNCLGSNPSPGCSPVIIQNAAKINVTHFFSEYIVTANGETARAKARGN